MSSYVEPELKIIRTPILPQRILLPPVKRIVRSASDMPVYENSCYTPASVPRGASLLVPSTVSQPQTKAAPLNMLSVSSGARACKKRVGKNWIEDLEGKTFSEVMPVLKFHHMPYRIMQIDGIMINNSLKSGRQEVTLTIVTDEGFSYPVTGNLTSDIKLREQNKVCSWFSQNNDKAVILSAKLVAC
jgi:hypothetical protein